MLCRADEPTKLKGKVPKEKARAAVRWGTKKLQLMHGASLKEDAMSARLLGSYAFNQAGCAVPPRLVRDGAPRLMTRLFAAQS